MFRVLNYLTELYLILIIPIIYIHQISDEIVVLPYWIGQSWSLKTTFDKNAPSKQSSQTRSKTAKPAKVCSILVLRLNKITGAQNVFFKLLIFK